MLRAATVLLHATLEDFMRSVENWKLPAAPEAALNDVALVGIAGRPSNFPLGKLAQFRGRTVEEVIKDSVSEHLNRKSYNNVGELVAALTRIGVTAPNLNQFAADLAALIDRRHHIVHQADREGGQGAGRHQARSLSRQRVETWLRAVEGATNDILAAIP